MAQKVHPKAFRLGVTQTWDGVWFGRDNYVANLREDVRIRDLLRKKLKDALVDRIEIERSRGKLTITLHSAKPGIIIGRAGAGIEELNKVLKKNFFRGRRVNLNINVKEVQKPSLSAEIVGQQIAADIEKRMPFRRVMKQARERVMKAGAEGVKIVVKGRLNGADIARSEGVAEGKIPLHNLRADIDFARIRAWTTYGTIGVRVWINRGEVFDKKKSE